MTIVMISSMYQSGREELDGSSTQNGLAGAEPGGVGR